MPAPDPPTISNHFPPFVRDALVRAAQTPDNPLDPLARIKAINRAIRTARLTNPNLFKPESFHHEDQAQ